MTGVVYGIRGLRKSLQKHLGVPANPKARTAVMVLGVVGYVVKGAVLLLTGVLAAVGAGRICYGVGGFLRSLQHRPKLVLFHAQFDAPITENGPRGLA